MCLIRLARDECSRVAIGLVAVLVTAAVLSGCEASLENIERQVAEGARLQSAQCEKVGSNTYNCSIYAGGRLVLTDCRAAVRGDELSGISHCSRVGEVARDGEIWDDLEQAFADQGLGTLIAFPSTTGTRAGEADARLSVVAIDGQGIPDPLSVEALVLPDRETATTLSMSPEQLAEAIFGVSDDFTQSLASNGTVLQDGRIIVWYRTDLVPEVGPRIQEALDAYVGRGR
jgi:hypothetical protein